MFDRCLISLVDFVHGHDTVLEKKLLHFSTIQNLSVGFLFLPAFQIAENREISRKSNFADLQRFGKFPKFIFGHVIQCWRRFRFFAFSIFVLIFLVHRYKIGRKNTDSRLNNKTE